MFCSVIIPTIGRPSLARAVQSVLEQALDAAQFEVVVVNDSGEPLREEPWMALEQVTVLQTQRRERSFARNTGASVARGDYFYFLDDDDWLLPGALKAFSELARRVQEAAWLHGGVQVVGADGTILAERNSMLEGNCLAQIMGGAWVPIQSSLIRAGDFYTVGGFSPFIRGTEDQDLCRRIAARGALANTREVVACLFRGNDWRTSTDYGRATEDTRLSRSHVVSERGIWRLMLASADSSYWRGRAAHVYISLALWQWRRRPLSSLSCVLQGAAIFLVSAPRWLHRTFWKALCDDHVPGSLHFIQMEWEDGARMRERSRL